MRQRAWFAPLVVLMSLLVSCTTTVSLPTMQRPDQAVAPVETEEPQAVAWGAQSTPELADMDVRHWTSMSPDNQWIAEGIQAFPRESMGGQMYYTGLVLRTADNKKHWVIIDEWAETGLGLPYPKPVHWGNDGQSFYYTNIHIPDGCGGGPFNNGWDLYKVDLDTGKVSEVISAIDRWLAVSPDGTTVAYVWGDIVLHDLASGQERKVSINISKEYNGRIVWSPDNKFLAVTLAIGACDTVDDGESTSILLVDTDSLMTQTVLWEDKRYLVAEEWTTLDQVVLKDPQGNKWILHTKSGEITSQP